VVFGAIEHTEGLLFLGGRLGYSYFCRGCFASKRGVVPFLFMFISFYSAPRDECHGERSTREIAVSVQALRLPTGPANSPADGKTRQKNVFTKLKE